MVYELSVSYRKMVHVSSLAGRMGSTEAFPARFVVGADGGTSIVRNFIFPQLSPLFSADPGMLPRHIGT